ncbi:MAG: hypothetical protein OEM19_04445 [Deltaproteobacteria bacterium]|nr:hypothetical protein [Deltaproteobacteria bacterium]
MDMTDSEKNILSIFQIYAKKPLAIYVTAGVIFLGAILFLKNGLKANSSGKVLVAGILFGLSLEGFIGAWVYPQLYSIILKLQARIEDLEKRSS